VTASQEKGKNVNFSLECAITNLQSSTGLTVLLV